MLQPVLLKTELVEKGFTLWEGRKNSEWMYPWKVTAIYSAAQRASQAKSPSVYLVQRTPQKHSRFFRKTLSSSQRKFWDTVTAVSAPTFSSLLRRTLRGHFTLPSLVNYVYPSFPRHWPMSSPTFPLTKFNGNTTHLLPSLCHAENFQKTYSWSKENPPAKIFGFMGRDMGSLKFKILSVW